MKFSDFTLQKLDKTFGLCQVREHPALTSWLQTDTIALSTMETSVVGDIERRLRLNVDNWNEQELSLNCIGPMLALVDLSGATFNSFAARSLSGVINGEELSGIPDGMVARGWREPEIPYFCLQEYKRDKDPNGDPAAQVLAAMLVAQHLNANDSSSALARERAVYGCYIVGRMWYFVVLSGTEYAMSAGHNAAREEIFEIFTILKSLKRIITEWNVV